MADRPTEDTVAIPRTPASNGTASNGAAASPTASTAIGATRTAPVLPPPAPAAPPTHTALPAGPPAPTREQKRAAKAAARQAAAVQAASANAKPRGRKARLRLTRIDPWSVMKTAFLHSIALGIVTVVSVLMVWTVLGAADVWSSINKTVQDVVGGDTASNFNIEDYIGTRRVVGFTMIVAAVDVVLVTAIATLGAFLYNMSASLLGGIEVTLAEDA